MFAFTARTVTQYGKIGLRNISTKTKPNNNNRIKYAITVIGGGAGVGSVAFLGFTSKVTSTKGETSTYFISRGRHFI